MRKKLTCPGCGAAGFLSSKSRICISEGHELREEVLSGSYFEWECPSCGKRYFYDDVFLYNDDIKRFMVYYVPGFDGQSFDVPTALKTDDAYDTKSSVLRVAADFVSFIEKIRILEEGLDDRAIEAIKTVYSSVHSESGGDKIYDMIFDETGESGTLCFSVFLEDEDFAVDIPRAAYEQTVRDFSSLFCEPDEKRFLRIDQKWLKETLGQS